MDGKKKLEELVERLRDHDYLDHQFVQVRARDIRSIADAFKTMEEENERLEQAGIAALSDKALQREVQRRFYAREWTHPVAEPAMKDDLIERCARALAEKRGFELGDIRQPYTEKSKISLAVSDAEAVLSIAIPAIREEAALYHDNLAEQHKPFRDVSAHHENRYRLHRQNAAAIRSLAHTTGQEGGR